MVQAAKLILIFFVISFYIPAYSFTVDKKLSNPKLEAEAQELFKELRCVVCTSQSLADSDADMAVDIRKIVRNKISNGSSKQEIIDSLVASYGNEIELKPRFNKQTYALWLIPLIILLPGSFWIYRITRKP